MYPIGPFVHTAQVIFLSLGPFRPIINNKGSEKISIFFLMKKKMCFPIVLITPWLVYSMVDINSNIPCKNDVSSGSNNTCTAKTNICRRL